MDVCGAPRSSADLFMLVVGFRSAPRFIVSLFECQGNFANASFERFFLGQQGSPGCGSCGRPMRCSCGRVHFAFAGGYPAQVFDVDTR